MFTICSDRPIPEALLKPLNGPKFPFSEMTVGDSLLLTTFREKECARASWHQFRKKEGLKWQFRTVWTEEDKGWRMWRIA
jgi:hypothetical protein